MKSSGKGIGVILCQPAKLKAKEIERTKRITLRQQDSGCETNLSGSSLNFTDEKYLHSYDRVIPIL